MPEPSGRDQRITEGTEAEKLLQHPLLMRAFADVQRTALRQIDGGPVEPEGAYRMAIVLQMVGEVRAMLYAAVRQKATALEAIAAENAHLKQTRQQREQAEQWQQDANAARKDFLDSLPGAEDRASE